MADDLGGLAHRIDRLAEGFTGRALQATMTSLGKAAVLDAQRAVRSDIGDLSMSNWRRKKPIEVKTRFELQGDSSLEVSPVPISRGPWRVLEDGRNAYEAGARRNSGLGKVRKDGTRKQKTRLVKHQIAATKGKDTWSDAVEIMERETPKRVQAEVTKAIGRQFGG